MLKVNKSRIRKQEIIDCRQKVLMLGRANSLFKKITTWIPADEGLEMIWSMWPGYLTGQDCVSYYCKTTGQEVSVIHTSGHATIEDLQLLAAAIKPKRLIPIHTLMPENFVTLFENVELLKDGQTIEI